MLILNVPRFRRANALGSRLVSRGKRAKVATDPTAPRPRTYTFLIPLLKLFGFRFTTLSKALEASSGKFACLTVDGSERELLHSVVPELDARGIQATVFVSTKDVARRPVAGGPLPHRPRRLAHYPMSWQTLKHLTSKGWEIGSLGHEPKKLTEMPYLTQKQQVRKSRDLLAKHLGQAPRVFAYPFGAYDATTLSCVRESGFAAAVTLRAAEDGAGEAADAMRPYQIPRLTLTGHLWRDLLAVCRQSFRLRSTTLAATSLPRFDAVRKNIPG